MAEGWSPPDVGQHGLDESCNNCADDARADYLLMPRSFCPFVSGERRDG